MRIQEGVSEKSLRGNKTAQRIGAGVGWGSGESLYKGLASEQPGEGEKHQRGTRPSLVMVEPSDSGDLECQP